MLKPAPRQKKKHTEDVFFFLCYTANLDATAKKSAIDNNGRIGL